MNLRALTSVRRSAAFTMVEIAICLAIIGLALVAIIGVLPLGMKVQRDNREETVINQDATVLLESIRNGVRGGYDLTNYVTEIDNYVTLFDQNLAKIRTDTYIYTLTNYTVNGSLAAIQFGLTNNARIVGLLSTPEFLDGNYNPVNLLVPNGISNHVEMNVRAMSGPAVEKPPQDNSILIGDSFTYRVRVVNAPVATDTNLYNLNFSAAQRAYTAQLNANLHELSLSFYWPVEPNGSLGTGRQSQRAAVAGDITHTQTNAVNLYYYQSQSFTNTPAPIQSTLP